MSALYDFFDRVDPKITAWMARNGITLLRVSLGIVFLWFGALKFVPGASPAETLATRTIAILTHSALTPHATMLILATWESLIGLGLLTGFAKRLTLLLLFLHMPGTLLPLVFFPQETFAAPFVPTLEGQYIIKNLVLLSAAIVIGATVRGGKLVPEQR